MVAALNAQLYTALIFIVVGAVFDFADGLVARLLGVSCPIGKELDSLADCITFGVAPSAMLFAQLSANVSNVANMAYLPFAAFILAAFSALRLAKFNLDTRQTTSFIGLPTPACALFWASLLASCQREAIALNTWALLAAMLLSCYLLVSELPMFAMKFKSYAIGYEDNVIKYSFLGLSAVALIVATVMGNVFAAVPCIIIAYIIFSVVLALAGKSED